MEDILVSAELFNIIVLNTIRKTFEVTYEKKYGLEDLDRLVDELENTGVKKKPKKKKKNSRSKNKEDKILNKTSCDELTETISATQLEQVENSKVEKEDDNEETTSIDDTESLLAIGPYELNETILAFNSDTEQTPNLESSSGCVLVISSPLKDNKNHEKEDKKEIKKKKKNKKKSRVRGSHRKEAAGFILEEYDANQECEEPESNIIVTKEFHRCTKSQDCTVNDENLTNFLDEDSPLSLLSLNNLLTDDEEDAGIPWQDIKAFKKTVPKLSEIRQQIRQNLKSQFEKMCGGNNIASKTFTAKNDFF